MGMNPTVTRELFDVDGNVLPSDSTDFVSQTISVKARKLLDAASVENVVMVPISTSAQITILTPSDV